MSGALSGGNFQENVQGISEPQHRITDLYVQWLRVVPVPLWLTHTCTQTAFDQPYYKFSQLIGFELVTARLLLISNVKPRVIRPQQNLRQVHSVLTAAEPVPPSLDCRVTCVHIDHSAVPVSYTHLTLPTNREV